MVRRGGNEACRAENHVRRPTRPCSPRSGRCSPA
jgi:hypothetical protein